MIVVAIAVPSATIDQWEERQTAPLAQTAEARFQLQGEPVLRLR